MHPTGLKHCAACTATSRAPPLTCTDTGNNHDDLRAPSERSLYPNIRGDLRTRPAGSAFALVACSAGGAVLGAIANGANGLLLGSAAGWMCASLGDTVAAAMQRRRAQRLRIDAEQLALLREEEVNAESDARLRESMNARLNRLLYGR